MLSMYEICVYFCNIMYRVYFGMIFYHDLSRVHMDSDNDAVNSLVIH